LPTIRRHQDRLSGRWVAAAPTRPGNAIGHDPRVHRRAGGEDHRVCRRAVGGQDDAGAGDRPNASYEIDPSELARVYPFKAPTEAGRETVAVTSTLPEATVEPTAGQSPELSLSPGLRSV